MKAKTARSLGVLIVGAILFFCACFLFGACDPTAQPSVTDDPSQGSSETTDPNDKRPTLPTVSVDPYVYYVPSVPEGKNIGVTLNYNGFKKEMIIDPSWFATEIFEVPEYTDPETGETVTQPPVFRVSYDYSNKMILITSNNTVVIQDEVDITSNAVSISVYFVDK